MKHQTSGRHRCRRGDFGFVDGCLPKELIPPIGSLPFFVFMLRQMPNSRAQR